MEVEDREERRFLTMEDGEDSVAGPPQRTCFVELSAECSRRLATLRKTKQRSQCTKEAKRARREHTKEESTLWRVFTSQVQIMLTFMFDSTVALRTKLFVTPAPLGPSVHIRTGTARHVHAYS